MGYTITTGDDNETWGGRNPKSWKLYGNNTGKDDAWTLIDEVSDDKVLKDENYTSYDFPCEGSTSYQYFKWEISAIHSGRTLQVGEFELKLNTCTHLKADGSSAFGEAKSVEATCTEHGYTTHECSICHLIVKEYLNDELKPHTLTHYEERNGIVEYWLCDVCHNCFSDANATQEIIACANAVFDDATKTLTFSYGPKPEGAYDLNVESNNPGWNAQKENIEKVVFNASFANARPTSCYYWFCGCSKLTDIEGIENLNTENVTDMSYMFYNCRKLSSLDFSKFNTENVTDMKFMFYNCRILSSLDLSKFNTENVTNMSYMFDNCYELSSLDLSKFNTENVTNMKYMFDNCWELSSLDLSNFNTAKVEDMSYMFSDCRKLSSLDLSNFNTAKVGDMSYMFSYCSTLTTIYGSDEFVTEEVYNSQNMFLRCKNLKGAIDKYDENKIHHRYANYKTGYFTKLVGKNGEEKIGATGEPLATENLVLDDGKDFVAYEPFAAKNASYSRKIKVGSTWGTLCLPFAIDQSKETECKFYRLTGIDNDCITLESYEGAEIPAGTPVLFKMNEGVQTLSIFAQDADLVKEPVAGTNTDVNLVGSFTKIGGNGNQGLDKNDYIIGKDKFWRVSDLDDGNRVGIKPMRAYIHPATASQARAAMLSIGKGDGTTAIDNLNAISNDANAEYYDANGRRTNGLQKGLNIVKRGSKTYKIMVK
ncbi:BspA family leucine-rich repeat surface protein [Segatella copri]|uniref:BspA family leucine-rich repeat surface protein n=2 Tax=Segatella copri TaxID=165179 RepID=A0AA92TXB7_9BACT|nr:BspA family leucine-rich repeat surface protein [Segatella copri]